MEGDSRHEFSDRPENSFVTLSHPGVEAVLDKHFQRMSYFIGLPTWLIECMSAFLI